MRLILFIFILFLAERSFSQHIEGNVTVDLEAGVFQCDLVVSDIYGLDDYKILLNHGMNIKYFKDSAGELIRYDGFYDGETRGEALEYYFVDDQGLPLSIPSSFKVEYTGAFPIYDSSYNWFDFKGYIAINSQTVRATEQAKWYPVLYDVKNDRLIDRYTYEITVQGKNCRSIFINGSSPQPGEIAHFSSSKAVPLFLFAGNYDYQSVNGDYLLNVEVGNEVAKKIFDNIDDIKKFYAATFDRQFEDNIYIVSHRAVKAMGNSNWGFNVYPALGFANLNFKELLTDKGVFKDHQYRFFGHELAHNYFGSNVMSGELYWFWLESGAEYLSFYVLEKFVSQSYSSEKLSEYANHISNNTFVPLTKIKKADEINSDYRYVLGPLILKCFEWQFGREKTVSVLKSLLDTSQQNTLDINTWKEAAIANGISKKEFSLFEKKFLSSNNFKENVIEQVREKAKSK